MIDWLTTRAASQSEKRSQGAKRQMETCQPREREDRSLEAHVEHVFNESVICGGQIFDTSAESGSSALPIELVGAWLARVQSAPQQLQSYEAS